MHKTKKYIVNTMGCQLNENDSEKLRGMLEEMGYMEANNQNEADIVIFNTCCVRENAEDRLFGKIRRIKKKKTRRGNNNCNRWLYDARKTYSK